MSITLSTKNIVDQVIEKLPYNFTTTWVMNRVNEAFRWIYQQGPFKFDLLKATLAFSNGVATQTPPYDFNPGGESILYSNDTFQIIPYESAEDFARHRQFTPTVAGSKIFAAWTFYGPTRTLVPSTQNLLVEVAPVSAVPAPGSATFSLVYHAIPDFNSFTYDANKYFPTPDEFDNLIMLKAEAETRFCYRYLGGWQSRMMEAENMAKMLVDRYRSTKKDLSGLVDNIRKSQEVQTRKSLS